MEKTLNDTSIPYEIELNNFHNFCSNNSKTEKSISYVLIFILLKCVCPRSNL